MSKGDAMDPLVVRTEDLARVLEPIIREQDEVYRAATGSCVDDRLRSNCHSSPILTGRQMLEENPGSRYGGHSSLTKRIFAADPAERSTHTALTVADSLLTACCQSHALQDGRIPVYKSPRWSIAGWEREIRARGVDDPWILVADERPHLAVAA